MFLQCSLLDAFDVQSLPLTLYMPVAIGVYAMCKSISVVKFHKYYEG